MERNLPLVTVVVVTLNNMNLLKNCLRRAGWNIAAAPEAYVHHHYYSMTGGKFSLQKIYWVERNHLWVAIKIFHGSF